MNDLTRRSLLRSGLLVGTGALAAGVVPQAAATARRGAPASEGHQYVGEVAIDAATAAMTVRLRGIDGSIRWATTLGPSDR